MKNVLLFKKYGCGCIGFDLGWPADHPKVENSVVVAVVKPCDRDSRDNVRWNTEEDVQLGLKPISVEQHESAEPLSAEQCEIWMRRIQKQLADGSTFRDVKYLMGINKEEAK